VQDVDQDKYASIQFMHPNGIYSFFAHEKIFLLDTNRATLIALLKTMAKIRSLLLPCLFNTNNKDDEEI